MWFRSAIDFFIYIIQTSTVSSILPFLEFGWIDFLEVVFTLYWTKQNTAKILETKSTKMIDNESQWFSCINVLLFLETIRNVDVVVFVHLIIIKLIFTFFVCFCSRLCKISATRVGLCCLLWILRLFQLNYPCAKSSCGQCFS